jgi:hypothetical protein
MPAMCHSHPAATALLHRAPSGITHAEVPIWRGFSAAPAVVRSRRSVHIPEAQSADSGTRNHAVTVDP